MKRGQIVGEVWATRKAPGLMGRRMTLVAVEGRLLVALDTLDARAGQEVLVALGSGARNVVQEGPQNRGVLCDAAVALLTDREAPQAPRSFNREAPQAPRSLNREAPQAPRSFNREAPPLMDGADKTTPRTGER